MPPQRNASSKKKKTPPPRKRLPSSIARAKNISSGRARLSRSNLIERICSLNDPFCPAANGMKLLDANPIRTIPYQYHQRFNLTTDASGNVAQLFLPGLTYAFSTAGTVTGSSAVFTTLLAGGVFSNVQNYRIVSYGLIFRKVTTPLTSSGMVRFRIFSPTTGAPLTTVDTGTYNCSHYHDVPLAVCNEQTVIIPKTDESYKFWRSPATTNPTANVTDWVSPGFAAVLVSVTGGPVTTTVVDCEVVINYEIILSDSDGSMQLATTAKRADPVLQQLSDETGSTMKYLGSPSVKVAGSNVINAAATSLSKMLISKMESAKIEDFI